MRIEQALLVFALLPLAACEDGPNEPFRPFDGNSETQNGYQLLPDAFVPGDSKGFDDEGGSDDVGRAKFCQETEETALAQEMVLEPLIPDVSVGGVPLWGSGGGTLYADDLLGARDAGKFCNPTGTFANAFTWGPTQEVILLFDPETRLVEGLIATQQYLGAMQGSFTEADGRSVEVVTRPRERLRIDGQELDIYASRVQAANEPRSWLNPANVTRLYRMVRETFFAAEPFPADFDCVATQICDLIYTGPNEDTPQDTVIALQDSGVSITFTPEGQIDSVLLRPVRSAPFENGGAIVFGAAATAEMNFGFQSQFRPTCALDLGGAVTWADFQSRCIASGDERALERVNYNVDGARDAVAVEFNGMNLHFLHGTSVLADGQRPDDSDALYSISFTRTLPAAVSEFSPLALGTLYKARLEQRLRDSVFPDAAAAGPDHPFSTFVVNVPFTAEAPQRIGELLTAEGVSWVPTVLDGVAAAYAALTPEEKAALDPRVREPVYLLEPFVDAVLSSFSHGESDAAGAVKAFRTTDDARWAIGYSSFTRAEVRYRLEVQYSLNFGAVTSVRVSRGGSPIDAAIEAGRAAPLTPYFEVAEMLGGTALSLASTAVAVETHNRQLGTLTVRVGTAAGAESVLEVAGAPLQDLAGYQRQLRGERFEFIPSHQVNLFGKETALTLWIREDGSIGKVDNPQFKGALELCAGLPVSYGDRVKDALVGWQSAVGEAQYRDCEVVFNYSENGNVLFSVASLANRRSFTVVDGRAVTASVWE